MTRTALKRNGFSRIPLRSIRQGAKAPFKTKEQGRELQNYYNQQKSLKKLLTKLLQSTKIIERAIDKWYNKVREKKDGVQNNTKKLQNRNDKVEEGLQND